MVDMFLFHMCALARDSLTRLAPVGADGTNRGGTNTPSRRTMLPSASATPWSSSSLITDVVLTHGAKGADAPDELQRTLRFLGRARDHESVTEIEQAIADAIDQVRPRLQTLRKQRGITLTALVRPPLR
jgi:hypothetical protein